MKVNLLSPDIYEIEDFVSIQEQEEVLNYCKTLDEAEWWKSYSPEYEKGFFFGKQKIGELPVIKQIVGAVKAVGKFFKKLFSDSRLKTDIVKVGQVEDINIYKFKFIYDKSKTQIGVIAQELLNTKYADCITTDPATGFYVVNYNILQQKVDIVGGIDRIQKELTSLQKYL